MAKKKKSPKTTARICPKRPKDVLFRQNVDGTVAIMKLDRDDFFFTLDGIAAECWTLIDGKSSVAAIAEKVTEKKPNERAFVEENLLNLVGQLQKEKLVEV